MFFALWTSSTRSARCVRRLRTAIVPRVRVLAEVPAVVLVVVVVVVGASRMFLASSDLLVDSQRTSWVVEKLEDDIGIDRHGVLQSSMEIRHRSQ
jgi:hypothetical protein